MESDFETHKEQLCLLSNLCFFLSHHGIKCSEDWLAGLLGSYGFCYDKAPEVKKNVVNGLSGGFSDIFQNYVGAMKHPLQKYELTINGLFIGELQSLLAIYGPGLIWIDQYYVEHSPYYLSDSCWSVIVVFGIQNEKVLYFDNGCRFIGQEGFTQAIDKGGRCELFFASKAGLGLEKREFDLVRDGLTRIIDTMKRRNNFSSCIKGIRGIRYFAGKVKRCDEPGDLNNFYYQINRPGGLTLTRDSMRRLLKELGTRYPHIDTSASEEIYTRLTNDWRLIGNLLFRLSVIGDNELRKRIVCRIIKAARLEEEGVAQLEQLQRELCASLVLNNNM